MKGMFKNMENMENMEKSIIVHLSRSTKIENFINIQLTDLQK